MREVLNRLAARAYAAAYDAVVDGFPPYEALVDEIAALVDRVTGGRPARILDVSCGTGTLAVRLARRGHIVLGLDPVEHLVGAARRRLPRDLETRVAFEHRDIARDGAPTAGVFDVVASLHTLYWHPDPAGLLAECRRALGPGGHAIVATYARPARIVATFRDILRANGSADAVRALRWLVPTALFEALRNAKRRYLAQDEFVALLSRAAFDALGCRSTFLGGISLLGLARPTNGVPPAGSMRFLTLTAREAGGQS